MLTNLSYTAKVYEADVKILVAIGSPGPQGPGYLNSVYEDERIFTHFFKQLNFD